MGNEAIDYINRDIVNVKSEIQTLNKLVRDGNGQPSLIQQVTTLSNRVGNMEINLHGELQEIRECVESLKQSTLNRSRLSWQFKTAIFVALITSFTSIYINWQNNQIEKALNESDKVSIVELNNKLDKLLQQRK